MATREGHLTAEGLRVLGCFGSGALSLLEGDVIKLLTGNEVLTCDVPRTIFTPNSNDDIKYRVDRNGNPVTPYVLDAPACRQPSGPIFNHDIDDIVSDFKESNYMKTNISIIDQIDTTGNMSASDIIAEFESISEFQ